MHTLSDGGKLTQPTFLPPCRLVTIINMSLMKRDELPNTDIQWLGVPETICLKYTCVHIYIYVRKDPSSDP